MNCVWVLQFQLFSLELTQAGPQCFHSTVSLQYHGLALIRTWVQMTADSGSTILLERSTEARCTQSTRTDASLALPPAELRPEIHQVETAGGAFISSAHVASSQKTNVMLSQAEPSLVF